MASSSFSAAKWATPDLLACTDAPPSLEGDVLVRDGLDDIRPVTNMWLVSLTMTTKSVMAGL